ncbi:hypothetical protein SAMN04487906_0303 [Zhouia amylolytica]|uniref:Uncharacterized protein n=1 Tax=Zhouia amylolytica TaxID=376730 RepID=A0A1I6PHL6_9FLAO|nr:hypothetical protein [Zhouia amylolytica]SFS39687.1 hypothetical protein SAMN04487906_0303 [Zhouia amylolytica]
MRIDRIILVTTFIVFSLTGYSQQLKLRPVIDQVYEYETELILEEDDDIAFMINFDFGLTYTNKDLDFEIVLHDIKGSMSQGYNNRAYFHTKNIAKENKRVQKLAKHIINKPLTFEVDSNGIVSKTYHLDINDAEVEGILNQLTDKFGNKKINPLKDIQLKTGYNWSELDSFSFQKNKKLAVLVEHTIIEVNKEEVIVESRGIFKVKKNQVHMGGTSIYDRKTGIQKLTKLMLNFGDRGNMYMLTKLQGYDYPPLIIDYQDLAFKKVYNNWYSADKYIDKAALEFYPFQNNFSNSQIEAYSESLEILSNNSNYQSISVYNTKMDTLYPTGSYIEVNNFYLHTPKGREVLKLIPGQEDYDSFSVGYLGEYYKDIYEPLPEGDTIEINLSLYIPTESRNLSLTKNNTKNKGITAHFDESAVVLSIPRKNYNTLLYNIYKAIRFYDADNKQLDATYNFLYNQDVKLDDKYTPDELITIFNDKKRTGLPAVINLEFKVKNAAKIIIETHHKFKKYSTIITKKISD